MASYKETSIIDPESMPLKRCPFCGASSEEFDLEMKTDLDRYIYRNSKYGDGSLFSYKAISEVTGVPVQYVSSLQHYEKDMSHKKKTYAAKVASAFGILTEDLLAFNPQQSKVTCYFCHGSAPWAVWNMRSEPDIL